MNVYTNASTLRALCAILTVALLNPVGQASASELASEPVQTFSGNVLAEQAAVAADHPLASQVGVDIMQAGGNAVDAAVAVGLVLGVVNPFASGLGGGGFLLVRTPDGVVEALDFRETAPAAAHRDMYVGGDGEVDRSASITGGLAVAVPGELAGFWAAHERYGVLPWATVIEPARALAADGFEAGTLLEGRLDGNSRLSPDSPLARVFQNEDGYVRAGDVVRRPGLARALQSLATDGPNVFYTGWIADDIAAAAQGAGGVMTTEDLAGYAPRWSAPVSTTYAGHTVHGMPLPSSGGYVIAQVLDMLSDFAVVRLAYDDAAFAHLVMSALAPAFAVRAHEMGDGLSREDADARFRGRRQLERARSSYSPVTIGEATDYGAIIEAPRDAGTSHFSVIDPNGMAVACTSTVNTSFGSLVLATESGIVLNNEMDDFASQPGVPNVFGLVGSEANSIAPGRRPLSSMSPTIVEDQEGLVGVLGGSGGPRIITGTLLALLQLIHYERTALEAVSAPRFHHQWLPFKAFVESTASVSWRERLGDFDYDVTIQSFGSAVQVIWRHGDGWQAASDPRKHGVAAGF
ncbi:MAG: gamma-glutamyltranspeptidase/glutathione hydrolase [Bradymonadia bacterium]